MRASDRKSVWADLSPGRLAGWAAGRLERRLPLRVWDVLYRFWTQTRLIMSRTTLVLIAGLMVFFGALTLGGAVNDPDEAYGFLLAQGLFLGILIHMNLWQAEREARTFELLLMRVPSIHSLIWLKLRVSLFWMVLLALPFFAGFTWFLSIPAGQVALYLVFGLSTAILFAFMTGAISTVVKYPLATAVAAFILLGPLAGISGAMVQLIEGEYPYFACLAIFVEPTDSNVMAVEPWLRARVLILNRLWVVALIAALYAWMHHRLSNIEKWTA